MSVIRQRSESQKRVFQENKAHQILRKAADTHAHKKGNVEFLLKTLFFSKMYFYQKPNN